MTDTLQSQLDQVLALSEKATPGVWEADSVRNDGCDFAKAVNTEGRSLFDTLNSEVALIETEADDDYVSRWDSQGRADIEAAIAAVNFLREHGPAILAAVGGEAVGAIDETGEPYLYLSTDLPRGALLYASPTATVDVGALRGLVEQWRELAGRLRHEAKNETGEDVRYPLTSFAYATRLDFCADELAALIGEKA